MEEKEDKSIHVGGSVSGAFVNTGEIDSSTLNIGSISGNITTISTVSIDKVYLEKMPKEYAESMQVFTESINKELGRAQIPSEKIAQIQASTNELAKEMVDVKPEEGVSFVKKNSVGNKLLGLARTIVRVSPKIAETLVSMTPLAPVSKLVGERFEKIVQDALAEK